MQQRSNKHREQINIKQINCFAQHQRHHPVALDAQFRTPRFMRGSLTNGDQAVLSVQKRALKRLNFSVQLLRFSGLAAY
jgi:predicted metal-binding protein